MDIFSSQIENLFRNRYHGAINIRGIKFQILYSILRGFDLYSNSTLDSITLEGIEDIDTTNKQPEIKNLQISYQYIQVKTSGSNWHWSNFKNSKIIQNFLAVWKLNSSSEFLVVTNFGYQDKLDELVKFCNGSKTKISKGLEQELERIFIAQGLQKKDINPFLEQLKFYRISEGEMIKQIRSNIVKYYELETNNSELYFLTLVSRFLDWAEKRHEIRRYNLEEIKHFVQDQIAFGPSNPAIQNGWLEKLNFSVDKHADDYYEGTNARPGHISAGLDVERAQWLNKIKTVLDEIGTCVIRTSSGQGKSTLLYRYAFVNYQPETTFIVKNLSDEAIIGSIKQAIIAKKTLGLPILVLIDNVKANLRYWHRLVNELTGFGIHFLITIREEDWFRYSGDISGFRWEIVTPELTLDEARKIYAEFQKKDKIAQGIASAENAFEQVAERKLLLEFTFLITHGQMLSERLREQVRKMQEIGEDKAKLHVLRLVSVAQIYQSKIATGSLLDNVIFSEDPDSTLESLRKEYLLFTDEGCEGLHLVRSQHLVEILHQVIPIENTIKELIQILDAGNLTNFVSSVFSDSQVNHHAILQTLIKRCIKESLETITHITEALFTANERNYFRQQKHLFDEAESLPGNGVVFLTTGTMPFLPYDILANFADILDDNPSFKAFFEALAPIRDRFPQRDWQNRTDTIFLQKILAQLPDETFLSGFESLGKFLNWCRLPGIEDARIKQIFSNPKWEKNLPTISVSALADYLFNLFYFARESYDLIFKTHKTEIQGQFKKLTETLIIEERENDIFIEFIVDETTDKKENIHEQTVNRLNLLYKMFPFYEHYGSQGLYAADFGVEREPDDTKKHIPLKNLSLADESDKNAIYKKIVESHYAVSSIYEWQKEWYELRRDILKFITDFIEAGQAASLGKAWNLEDVDRQFQNLRTRFNKQKELPESLGERILNAQRDISSWFSSTQTFVSQVFQEDENARRLCRINLRDAASRLFKAQDAFRTITSETHEYFDFSILDEGEIEKYFYLADVLDALYGDAENFPIKNLRTYIADKKKREINKVVERLRASFSALEKEGFSFVYPKKLLVKSVDIGGLEYSICIGFEVVDFTRVMEQVEIILRSFPSFDTHYWNLYLLPLLNGKIYSENLWRISLYKISQLNAGEQVGAWSLLPQSIDKEILSTLPELEKIDVPEIKIISNFNSVCMEFHVIRNTRSLLVSHLDNELESDRFLANLYQNRLQRQMDKLLKSRETIFAELNDFTEQLPKKNIPAEELSAWDELIQKCSDKYEAVKESLNQDLTDYENKIFWFDREIDTYLGKYLNIKYKKALDLS